QMMAGGVTPDQIIGGVDRVADAHRREGQQQSAEAEVGERGAYLAPVDAARQQYQQRADHDHQPNAENPADAMRTSDPAHVGGDGGEPAQGTWPSASVSTAAAAPAGVMVRIRGWCAGSEPSRRGKRRTRWKITNTSANRNTREGADSRN